jgi:hypothetical protein
MSIIEKTGDKLHVDTIFDYIFRELVLLSKWMQTAQTTISQLKVY